MSNRDYVIAILVRLVVYAATILVMIKVFGK